MPFAFLLTGALLIIAGIRGTDEDLFNLVKGDFTGKPSFISWLFAILLIGSLGYIEPIKPVSRAFLFLVLVVLFLSNGGVFQKFVQGIESAPASPVLGSGIKSDLPTFDANGKEVF